MEDHGLVEEVTSTSKGNTIDPIDCYRRKKEGSMRDIGRQCAGCYAKGSAQQSREAGYAAAKKVKTFCSDCDKFFCLECFNDKHHAME